jgi:transcription-repair coupling factor (superfamily II helicase)
MSSSVTYQELLLFLRKRGFREGAEIEQSADFIVRGDTITWWPVSHLQPLRYTFFDAQLEEVKQRQTDGSWAQLPLKTLPELEANEVATEHGTIHPGDYIVHPAHGVGIFEYRSARLSLEGEARRFISLQYAGNDRILFPADREKELMPYIGSRSPRLTRLYSKAWANTKERIEKDLIGIARELLRIYAKRHHARRPVITWHDDWEAVLDASSGFTLTEDQARAMQDMRNELAGREFPMDRLVCGDVGFGKTELALRVAAQVVANGRQVALIAPTTVLAEQHYELLRKRFADLPIKLEHLSRLTAGREKEVLAKVAAGQVDVLVGTHRVLGKDVAFPNLGIMILDEEQKFGVAQKEVLKEVRPHLDVLSLSATPIPRTLSMSLSGLRGLSILRTPPHGRKPVQTVVMQYDDGELQKALAEELARGGQCYVVHNRVQSLASVQNTVKRLLDQAGFPEARIAMGHGQMNEVELARTLSQFMAGSLDVLVASSIVEHGLDVPGANTLVVLHSEWFGLSDLYQLRGRVGRRQTQAKAVFMLGGVERSVYEGTEESALVPTDATRKRLEALVEADQLGSGWSVALRDMEIRGGGNILGHEQHGNMETIGLLLYSQLLQEAIGRQAKALGIPIFQNLES